VNERATLMRIPMLVILFLVYE